MTTIFVDNREKNNRIKSFVKHFTGEDFKPSIQGYQGHKNNIIISQIPIGDYVFDEKVCFEFKTAIDMIGSIIDKRVFRQAERMKKYPYSYIMIVGDVSAEIDTRNTNQYWKYQKYGKQYKSFTNKHYLGAVARLSIDSKVLHVNNTSHAWMLMESIVNKIDDIPVKFTKPNVKSDNSIASFLSCIYVDDAKTKRLSSKKALLICEELNLKYLHQLLNITYDDLVNIKGIGGKTANRIIEVIR